MSATSFPYSEAYGHAVALLEELCALADVDFEVLLDMNSIVRRLSRKSKEHLHLDQPGVVVQPFDDPLA